MRCLLEVEVYTLAAVLRAFLILPVVALNPGSVADTRHRLCLTLYLLLTSDAHYLGCTALKECELQSEQICQQLRSSHPAAHRFVSIPCEIFAGLLLPCRLELTVTSSAPERCRPVMPKDSPMMKGG